MHATSKPELSGIVIHWRCEAELRELVAAWPRDPRFELIVVDNSSSLGELDPPARLVDPGCNLGFGAGANRGAREARSPILLILNPDIRPRPGAFEALLEGFKAHPDAAGLAPALEDSTGQGQHAWQLRPLPGLGTLLLQTLLIPAGRGPDPTPAPGARVEQPAAAALALDRQIFEELGGFDEGYYPAWFEDVDLARRWAQAGKRLRYWPASRFVHGLGASVPKLGYGSFLWIYYRNLCRYLECHHGAGAALLARLTLSVGLLLRLALLPLRRPRRAASRREAAAGLVAALVGAASGWRWPRRQRRISEPPAPGETEP